MALRLILRLAGVTFGLLLLFMAGGQMLSQADANLEAFDSLFMTSSACDTPCLMGIQPGMLLRDAEEVLGAHPWVDRVYSRRISQFESRLDWTWSGQQPDHIDSQVRGKIFARSGRSHDVRQQVYRVQVTTRLRFQSLFLALGETGDGMVQYRPQDRVLSYEIRYHDLDDDLHVSLDTVVDCPAYFANFFWLSQTSVSQVIGTTLDQYVPPQALPIVCRAEGQWPSIGSED